MMTGLIYITNLMCMMDYRDAVEEAASTPSGDATLELENKAQDTCNVAIAKPNLDFVEETSSNASKVS